MLETQALIRAFSRAWAKTGKRIAASIAMMAITTRSSIRVKAVRRCMAVLLVSRIRLGRGRFLLLGKTKGSPQSGGAAIWPRSGQRRGPGPGRDTERR